MKNSNELINKFLEASVGYGVAIEKGDSNKANKYSRIVRNIRKQLYDVNELELLKPFLNNTNEYVKLNAATSLMSVFPNVSQEILVELAGQKGIFAFEAEMFLEEWKKNNIIF